MKQSYLPHLFLFFFSLSLVNRAFTASTEKLTKDISKSIDVFSELEALRKEEMGMLRFENSPIKVNSSRAFKFVLRDQLGRDWLFKAGVSSTMDGAVAVHRISLLLGVDSPRTHYRKLEINGQQVTGSLQELIPNVRGFSGNWAFLNENSRNYVLKNHILSWLLANHHMHPEQFLMRKNAGSENELVRIDNSINWMLLGSDRLDVEYRSPMMSQTPFAGYADFWNQYLYSGPKFKKLLSEREKVKDAFAVNYDLNLDEAIRLAYYISLLPNDFYKEFFAICIQNNLFFTSNNEAIASAWLTPANFIKYGDKSKFLDMLLARKESIFKDYMLFFKDLKEMRGEKWSPDLSEKAMSRLVDKINAYHQLEITEIKQNIEKLKKNKIENQNNIVRPVSLDLYYIMNRLGESLRFNKKDQFIKLLKEIKEQMLTYKKNNKLESQSEAIDNALKNLEDLSDYATKNEFDKIMYFWIAVNSNQLFESEYVKNRIQNNPFKYIK